MAIGILQEKIHLYHIIGGLMALVGVIIAQVKPRNAGRIYAKG